MFDERLEEGGAWQSQVVRSCEKSFAQAELVTRKKRQDY